MTLSRQLRVPLQRAFAPQPDFQPEVYAEMCQIEGWSVRTLRVRIDSMLYERTALSKQPNTLIRQELAILPSKGDVTQRAHAERPLCAGLFGADRPFSGA